MFKKISMILIVTAIGLSCVTNRKIQYLQHSATEEEGAVLDSTVRLYDLHNYEYRVQPADILSIQIESLTRKEFDIFGSDESTVPNIQGQNAALFGELVDDHGTISLHGTGKVKVEGLTLQEIRDEISELALNYVDDPIVKVRLLNFRFTVLGEVINNGTINTFNSRVTIFEGIGLAGGLTDLADRSKIKVIRKSGTKTTIHYLNLLNETFVGSRYYLIYPSDIIVVPPLKQRPFRKYFGPNFGIALSAISTILLVINLIVIK